MLREKQTAYALIAVSILVLSGGIYWLVVPMMTTKNETTTAIEDCYRGLELINDGNSAQAIAPLEQAVELLPAYKDGAFYASTAHNRRGAQIDSRPALALAEFDKSIFYDPTNQKPIVNSATMIRLLGKNPDRAADRLEFANSALANKDYKAAIVEYEAALACNDVGSLNAQKQKEIKQLLADVYKQASERPNSEAVPQFVYAWANLLYKINAEIAEAQDPALQQKKLAEKYLSQGVAHSTTGDDAAAEKEYKDALKAQESYPHTPTYTKTLNAIGGFYLNRKNYTQAETYFKQAMHEGEADPLLGVFNLSESYRLYGTMLNQTGQSKMAKQYLEKSDNTLHQMRATIQDYDLAIKKDPNNASNYFLQAMLLRQGSDWKAELTDYDKAINLNPHYAYALTDRASLLRWKKRDQEALSDLNQAIESDPNFNPALRTRGQFYRDHEKWTLAKADLDRALALVKDDEDSLLTRGLVDVNLGKESEALADFDQAIKIKPDVIAGYNNRGLLYSKQKKYLDSIRDFDKVLQINPRSYKAYSFRGRAYAGLAKYPEAIADYDRYLAANPNDAQMLIFRGGAHWYLKHYDQAVADFSKSISINPQECSGEAYFYRAKVYDAQGKTGLAAADRKQAADQGYKP